MPITVINADTGINQIQKNTLTAAGGGTDYVFHLNTQTVATSYTLPAGTNASSVGPIQINNGIVVTVPNGANWAIL